MDLLIGGSAPLAVGLLTALAIVAVWMAMAPARPARAVTNRLSGYGDRSQMVRSAELEGSMKNRAVVPVFRRLLRFLGGLLPQRNVEKLADMLTRAGNPGGMSVLDFVGLRLMLAAAGAILAYLVFSRNETAFVIMRNGLIGCFVGFMAPKFWLGRAIKKRRAEIAQALPDALDMLTIGVEAGLAFESALLRVGDQWDNALSQEFRRVVSEMRVGVPRNEALRHMAERTDCEDLRTFVAVLIQSNQLGVSISQVLHTQADQMRIKRRQHAEEKAHAATVKIVLVLVVFIFPSLFIVILGPAVPRIMHVLGGVAGR